MTLDDHRPRGPGQPDPFTRNTASSSWQTQPGAAELRRQVRDYVARGLAERTRLETGSDLVALNQVERRELAQQLATQAADAYAQSQLAEPTDAGVVPEAVEQQVIASVLDELFGLGRLQPLLADDEIENININGCDQVFVRYADGRREAIDPVADTDDELIALVRSLAARSGVHERRFDPGSPTVDVELPDGARLFAVMALSDRPSVAIRRHRWRRVTLADLRRLGTIDAGLEALLSALVRARFNLLIEGGPMVGKTTLLRALSEAIPPDERLITIEDNFELGLKHNRKTALDGVALQAREANIEGYGEFSQAQLVRSALRMSPDRVIVGEVRGDEIIPMLNAMTQGSDGSMATVHASSSDKAFGRLMAYAAQAPERLSPQASALLIANSVHFVIHLAEAYDDKTRVVSSIREVVTAEDTTIVSNEVYRPDATGRAVPAAPLRTDTVAALQRAGLDPAMLDRPDGWWQP